MIEHELKSEVALLVIIKHTLRRRQPRRAQKVEPKVSVRVIS